MQQFYTKDDAGEYHAATDSQLSDYFKENSNRIVSYRIKEIRESEVAKAIEEAKGEIEKAREETLEKLREEARTEVEGEMQSKMDELTKAKTEVETKLRRKTIAAEYGFKPEIEEFLGSGSDDEMRAKADSLKSNFQAANQSTSYPEKGSTEPPAESTFVRLNKSST